MREVKNTFMRALLANRKNIEMTIKGNSMIPTMFEGDVITVAYCNEYKVGDILVFFYKEGMLLAHRLLKLYNDRYYCKGDNSLRLEDVKAKQIIGRVMAVNGSPLKEFPLELIDLSYAVAREFHYQKYNMENTKNSDIYTQYSEKLKYYKEQRDKY